MPSRAASAAAHRAAGYGNAPAAARWPQACGRTGQNARPTDVDAALEKSIQAQLRGGKGMRKVARELGVGTGTVQRVKAEMEGPFVGTAA